MTDRKGRKTRRLIIFIAIVALFIGTNPNEEKHLNYIGEYIRKDMRNDDSNGILFTFADVFVGENTMNRFLKNIIIRKNYVLFSYTEFQIEENDEKQIATIGLLGNVFMVEELKTKVDKIVIKIDQLLKKIFKQKEKW